MSKLTVGSLFAGVGGLELGLEMTGGFETKWQVESDAYARRVLERHWPDARRWDDVRTFPPAGEWGVDVVCGGFPCQNISDAGHKIGIGGEQSRLWGEMHRIICLLRPRFAIVENVAAVLDRGHEQILGDMATSGFDGEWEVLSACAFGAPHSRERMFYIFYPHSSQLRASRSAENQGTPAVLCECGTGGARQVESWWSVEPEPCSVVYGISGVVDQLRPYGNAVVPQVAQYIGERILAHERTHV